MMTSYTLVGTPTTNLYKLHYEEDHNSKRQRNINAGNTRRNDESVSAQHVSLAQIQIFFSERRVLVRPMSQPTQPRECSGDEENEVE